MYRIVKCEFVRHSETRVFRLFNFSARDASILNQLGHIPEVLERRSITRHFTSHDVTVIASSHLQVQQSASDCLPQISGKGSNCSS